MKIKPILLTSLIFNFVLILVVINFFLKENNLFRKRPELMQQITTNNIAEAKIQFNDIVQKEFQIEISERELIKELSRQGFTPAWPYRNEPHRAVFINSNIACNSVWSVLWEVDKLGNITKVNGRYIAGCP